jgi:aryl-alcohol dehydrogenase-like predicted oxidoreductase
MNSTAAGAPASEGNRRFIGERGMAPVGLGGVHWSVAEARDDELSIRTVHAALDAGVTLIDTAHAYTTLDEPTHNESIVRRALAGRTNVDKILVATKGGHWRKGAAEFPIDGRPETLRLHLEQSLRALGVEEIGLYQLHHPDPKVPIEESVGALAEFQREGLVKLIGVSNFSDEQVSRALSVATIDSVQNYFSPFKVTDRGLIARLGTLGIAYLSYSPFGGRDAAMRLDIAMPQTSALALSHGISIHRLLVAWHLELAANVIPIVGARRPSSIVDSFLGAEVVLSTSDFVTIDGEATALSALETHP